MSRLTAAWDRYIFTPFAMWLWWHVTAESRKQAEQANTHRAAGVQRRPDQERSAMTHPRLVCILCGHHIELDEPHHPQTEHDGPAHVGRESCEAAYYREVNA